MANIPITGLLEASVPGAFPIFSDVDMVGGHRVEDDNTARDAIPAGHRIVGMTVYSVASGITYRLVGGILNANWAAVTSGGDAAGPAGATDNAIARFDGATGKLLQNSTTVVDDNGSIFAGTTVTASEQAGSVVAVSTGSTAKRGMVSTQHSSDVQAGRFVAVKTRGTRASPTTVANGDAVGRFVGIAFDGTSYLENAYVGALVNGTVTTGSVPVDLVFFTGSNGTPTEAMRLTSAQIARFASRVEVNSGTPILQMGLAPGTSGASATTDAAATGDIRGRNGFFITGRSVSNAVDTAILQWSSDTLVVGNGSASRMVAAASVLQLYASSSLAIALTASQATFGTGYSVGFIAGTGGRFGGINNVGGGATITFSGEDTGNSGSAAGKATVRGGNATNGIAGDLELQAGHSTSGTDGAIKFLSGAGTEMLRANNTGLGAFGATPVARPTVSGNNVGEAATSLLAALVSLGLTADNVSSWIARANPRDSFELLQDFGGNFLTTTSGGSFWGDWTITVGGTAASAGPIACTDKEIGVLELNSGTDANSYSSVCGFSFAGYGYSVVPSSDQLIELEWKVRIPTLSDATNTFVAVCGTSTTYSSGSDSQNNGIGFEYIYNGTGTSPSDTHWKYVTANAGSRTKSVSTITVVAGQYYRLMARKAVGSATSWQFFIDGVSVGTQSTNAPTAGMGPLAEIEKKAGGTARTMQIDWCRMLVAYPTAVKRAS